MSRKGYINLSLLGIAALLALGFALNDHAALQWGKPVHASITSSGDTAQARKIGFIERALLVYGSRKGAPGAKSGQGGFSRTGSRNPD